MPTTDSAEFAQRLSDRWGADINAQYWRCAAKVVRRNIASGRWWWAYDLDDYQGYCPAADGIDGSCSPWLARRA